MSEFTSIAFYIHNFISHLLQSMNFSGNTLYFAEFFINIAIMLCLAIAVHYALKYTLFSYLINLRKKTTKRQELYFLNRKVFHRLVHLIPASILYTTATVFLELYPKALFIANKLIGAYSIIMIFASIQAALHALEDMYNSKPDARERPIRSYIQLLVLISYLIAGLIVISLLFDIHVTRIFAGLGALAAVLMLIFKDTILGLVAGVQLSANKMVQVGDWIEMPAYNADGDVLEITLNTVKVQNWDKTITTVPTYALVSSPFINWRGMHESGGRRIKRSVYIDMNSVTFCTEEMLQAFRKIHHLRAYLDERQLEIEQYNKTHNIDNSVKVNGRRLTNLGVFRKYLENYCKSLPRVNKNMTFIIRHLQPTEKGIPMELYMFSADTSWVNYEELQSDIFDHVLAVIPEFKLKVFQVPSGDDIRTMNTIFAKTDVNS